MLNLLWTTGTDCRRVEKWPASLGVWSIFRHYVKWAILRRHAVTSSPQSPPPPAERFHRTRNQPKEWVATNVIEAANVTSPFGSPPQS